MTRKQRATATQEFETGIEFFVFDVLWTVIFDFVMVVCDRKGYPTSRLGESEGLQVSGCCKWILMLYTLQLRL
jgi:hypothetical protein